MLSYTLANMIRQIAPVSSKFQWQLTARMIRPIIIIIIIIVTVCGYSFQNIQLKKYVIKPSPRISLATATTALQEE